MVRSGIRTRDKMKKKKTPIKPFSEEAKAFFQLQNDQVEFMVEPTGTSYIEYIMGDLHNTYDGLDMDTSFDELDSESDWFMD